MTEPTVRPRITWFSEAARKKIVAEAIAILEEIGVFVENAGAVELLDGAGARAGGARGRVRIPSTLVEGALATVPGRIVVYDRPGRPVMDLGEDRVHFTPGSAALRILDPVLGRPRPAVTSDLCAFATLTDALPAYAAQSTALIPSDVPQAIADRYRLFLALRHSVKPVVTGTFKVEGFRPMHAMLAVVAGGEEELRERPLAIFDCCPSSPLKWSELTCQALLDCARAGLPAELVSMPMTGATSPVTLAGALTQHCAENLSGIVIHQLAAPGGPVIYGGSPACFDMREGTTPVGAVEAMMMDGAYAEIGKHLGVPTHAYTALSDAKTVDWQAGAETGMGAVMAVLSGINHVAGPGMLDFECCQSLEKLVLDHEACRFAQRLAEGVALRDDLLALPLIAAALEREEFLSLPHTGRWFLEEVVYPDPVIDRGTLEVWERGGRYSSGERARGKVGEVLASHRPAPLAEEVVAELTRIMAAEARSEGMDRLPASRS